MAPSLRSTAVSLVSAVSLVIHQALALQVSPNSPCSAECIDSSDLDISDPNSSNTISRDIVCPDSQYDTNKDGVKFKNCMTCLQNSTYSQGAESDQGWFLCKSASVTHPVHPVHPAWTTYTDAHVDNMRYAFDYCILGYPNATSMGTNPCRVPEACGRLSRALETGIMNPAGSDRLAYCDASGGTDTKSYWDSCRGCVMADGQHAYLSNCTIASPPTSIVASTVSLTCISPHCTRSRVSATPTHRLDGRRQRDCLHQQRHYNHRPVQAARKD